MQDIDVSGLRKPCFRHRLGMGQQLLAQIGQTGIPVYNVSNACATGATALRTAYMSIKAGESEMGLAVGVEQMGKMGLVGWCCQESRTKIFMSLQGATGQ